MFLKISQNSQENTSARVSFLIHFIKKVMTMFMTMPSHPVNFFLKSYKLVSILLALHHVNDKYWPDELSIGFLVFSKIPCDSRPFLLRLRTNHSKAFLQNILENMIKSVETVTTLSRICRMNSLCKYFWYSGFIAWIHSLNSSMVPWFIST